MTVAALARQPRGDARALRFLLLLIGGWTLVRALAYWSPAIPHAQPGAEPPVSWGRAASPPRWAPAVKGPGVGIANALSGGRETVNVAARPSIELSRTAGARTETIADAGGRSDGGLHQLRLALIARLLPSLPGATAQTAFPADHSAWVAPPDSISGRAGTPGAGQPFWMQRQLAGWSLGSWVHLRGGAGRPPEGISAAGQIGGSQAGARLAYGFGDRGRLRAYGRATIALAQPRQREVALGFAFAPVARWPVDVAVEQRLAAGSAGRTALAAMVTAGVGDVALPHDFRLEAYGQAGMVGARRRDGFVDAALVIDREVARLPDAALHLGGLAAGAAQPGAARLDVGPRATLRLPEIGGGSRVALDWRQRVAGDARPESGLALTLAADF